MLSIERLSAHYGAARALDDVSLHVAEGELACIVGPNGAGKSTLVNAIAGLIPATSGSVKVAGAEMTCLPPHRLIEHGIAIVPEGRRLFVDMSVRENLELGSLLPPARVRRQKSLDEVCRIFPILIACLDRRAGTLSGGQQQMVAIARALMARPRLLLLDEPSLGLAPIVVVEMFRTIRRINDGGTTILLVEQNVAAALDIASRAFVLDVGRIVAQGTPDELLAQPFIQRAYFGTDPMDAT